MKKQEGITFSGETTYIIKVQGKLDTSWSESLSGLIIETKDCGENTYVTTLRGVLKDQSALSGVMNFLYDMHLSVISVESIGSEKKC